jgi:hypothetical protein
MENLEQWLESLGLSRYFKLFVDNDLDLEVLPELSEVHLESLGVSLGHRLKLLRAIRQLQSAETNPYRRYYRNTTGSRCFR